MATYHRDVFWPEGMATSITVTASELSWTRHALERVQEKRIPVPTKPRSFDIIELTSEGKQTIRTSSMVPGFDLVLVVHNGRVITCWLNDRNDKHSTLNRAMYVSAPTVNAPDASSVAA